MILLTNLAQSESYASRPFFGQRETNAYVSQHYYSPSLAGLLIGSREDRNGRMDLHKINEFHVRGVYRSGRRQLIAFTLTTL